MWPSSELSDDAVNKVPRFARPERTGMHPAHACVMRACDGEWGFGESSEPGDGTRLWAVLPREGARAYGRVA
ncbi:hypothetical protein San01_27840 [Streptomyces angustmyceticus]|uniref:Uncharacterized protein n=1 Tax=Streptomyces angustmyceticus TaxID=285578 RepID=A0A5J4L7F9_9ACTN|nr:hypothetical protein San01_27840 [Streptomyces angustmyceticus]